MRRVAALLVACVLAGSAGASLGSRSSTDATLGGSTANVLSVALPALNLSFDSNPAYSEFDSIQPGVVCDGSTLTSTFSQPATQAFRIESSIVRHGAHAAYVNLPPGAHADYSCEKEAALAIKELGEGEGTEAWWGWSWRFPADWRRSSGFATLSEWTVNATCYPSYGMLSFDASIPGTLQLLLHTGRTPDPGASSYDAAYNTDRTILGRGTRGRPGGTTVYPFVTRRWMDFIMHTVWYSGINRSHPVGVLQVWYRVQGAKRWHQIYSDVPGDHAAVQVKPHPTLLYNTRFGAPGTNGPCGGLELEGGVYRTVNPWTANYWWDGQRRRPSAAAVLAGFP